LALGGALRRRETEARRDARGYEWDEEDDRVGDLKGRVLALRAGKPYAAAQETRVGVDRIGARREADNRADDECKEDRAEGHAKPAGEAPDGRRHRWRSRTGAFRTRPRGSGYAGMSAGGTSAPDLI
jgi:hypothetical protein